MITYRIKINNLISLFFLVSDYLKFQNIPLLIIYVVNDMRFYFLYLKAKS